MSVEIPDNLPDYIKSKIEVCDDRGCWRFNGDPSSNGYQRLYYSGSRFMAHIFMWEWITGKKAPHRSENKTFDHLCEVRDCCNPNHLQLVSHSINCKRKFNRRKTV